LNTGSLNLILKPRHERELSADEIIQQLRPKLAAVPGIRVYMQNPPAIRIGGQVTAAQYQYTLQSTDLDELYQWTDTLLGRIRQLPGFIDVTSNLNNRGPVVTLNVDRDKIAALGLTFCAGRGRIAKRLQFLADIDDLRRHKPVPGDSRSRARVPADPSKLSRLYVRASSGKLVPLDTVTQSPAGHRP
jgi:hydrophobic/amphiphilic exporter-1 (mainly G- bacteria), HAE1 family